MHLRRQGGQLGAPLGLARGDERDVVEALGDLGEHVAHDPLVDRRRRPHRGRASPRRRAGRAPAASPSGLALVAARRDVSAAGSTRLATIAPRS